MGWFGDEGKREGKMEKEKKKMKLKDFIREMLDGWGFRRPYRVKRIGEDLAKIIPSELGDTEVDVEFEWYLEGWGPGSKYRYFWTVTGVALPYLEGGYRAKPDVSVALFGGRTHYFEVLKNGFIVGYDW